MSPSFGMIPEDHPVDYGVIREDKRTDPKVFRDAQEFVIQRPDALPKLFPGLHNLFAVHTGESAIHTAKVVLYVTFPNAVWDFKRFAAEGTSLHQGSDIIAVQAGGKFFIPPFQSI